jgi:hypothetical protein
MNTMKMSDVIASQCLSCKHKNPGLGTCEAFPDGIRAPILQNHLDHREPIDGDHGIRWERDANSGFANPLDRGGSDDEEREGVIGDILAGAFGDDSHGDVAAAMSGD